MVNNLRTIFDNIRAEDTLKNNIRSYLIEEIEKREKPRNKKRNRSIAVALISLTIIILSASFSYNIYYTPSAYVDMDVNPSIELTLNRFDRVINEYAYNEEGREILSELSLRHKSYKESLLLLIDAIELHGYFPEDGLISITLQTDDKNKETELLSSIQKGVADNIIEYHHNSCVEVFTITDDTRNGANEYNISPAKYLAIMELIETDSTASIESCREHSISEIKRLTREHIGGHHNDNNSQSQNNSGTEAESEDSNNSEGSNDIQNSEHHGTGGGHHGGKR